MTTEELIAKAKSLLEGTSPAPWKAHEWSIDSADRYREVIADMSGCSDQDRRLIETAPTIIRELVEALEAMIRAKTTPKIKKVTLQRGGVLERILYLWDVEHICATHGALMQSEDGEWYCPVCNKEEKVK